MHSLYKTFREIWEAQLAVLLNDKNLLSAADKESRIETINVLKAENRALGDNQTEEVKEKKKSLNQRLSFINDELSKSKVIQKEIERLQLRLTEPMADTFDIPTQVRCGQSLGLKTQSIKTKYQYDPALTITKNAEASLKAWMELKQYLQLTFLPDTYSLAQCSDTGYVYSQEFAIDI